MDSIAYFFSKNTFEITDVIQIKDYEINLDEETNAKTSLTLIKEVNAKDKDIVLIKEKEKNVFMGIIEAPTSNSGVYEIKAKYITNLFDRKIMLKNSEIIKNQGIEDFIAYTINNEFINSKDTLLNIDYIDIEILSHTPKNFSVNNDNGIYNFHTFINNCTQKYGIVYNFSFENGRIKMSIRNIEEEEIQVIDTNVSDITDYIETLKTNIIAKVTVVCGDKSQHDYFLLNDRTTTEDINAENRAIGDIEVVYEENVENAKEAALNTFKKNSYSHLIQFNVNKNSKLYDVENWKIGKLVKIKNKSGNVIDTYISAITIKKDTKIYIIKTGNIRINILDKLKQERK